MAYNWLMMTSAGDENRPSGSLGLLTDKTTKIKNKNKPKAEQETAQPTAARFKKQERSQILTALLNFSCFSLSTTVETHCTFQRSP